MKFLHPANLTHQFRRLEQAGLIDLVEKRDIGRNIEKYYRATAYTFTIQWEKQTQSNKKTLALSILQDDLALASFR